MSKLKQIYQELGITKDIKENNVLNNLTKTPPKEGRDIMPHTMASVAFSTEQVDTLYFANDNGFKYILVIVDVATRLCDAQPMKTRDAKTTVKALEKIFKRGIVKRPKRLEVDQGTEFKGDFDKHFKKFFKILRKEAGRHRQQSVVETKNQQIGKILNARMTAEEINNDATSRNWVDILPKVVKLLNKHYSHKAEPADPTLPIKTDKLSRDILDIGTKVRIQLDNPVSYVDGDKLHGKFRTGDIRFTKNVGIITRFYLRPGQPVMYQVNDNKNVAYTRPQLQVVTADEVKPSTKAQKVFYAQEIVSKRVVKGVTYYKVRFEDNDIVEMDSKQVRQEIPDLLKEFNKKK
jgi:hypothetical protein